MKILALEFSSPQRSVAFVDVRCGEPVLYAGEVVRSGGRATPALAMIEEVLAQAGVERHAVECVAVGLGPGSYTGVRAAIALAQGWQLAQGTRLIGLGSVECIAAQAHADRVFGQVMVVVDAQRGELYVAEYAIHATGWRETRALRIAGTAELQAARRPGQVVAGPEVKQWFADGRVVFPRAETLGILAARQPALLSGRGEELKPVYLREIGFVKAPPPSPLPPLDENGRR